jgi:hypothetical protein
MHAKLIKNIYSKASKNIDWKNNPAFYYKSSLQRRIKDFF